MNFNYPNGKKYHNNDSDASDKKPYKKLRKPQSIESSILYGDRGMTLEEQINISNNYYKDHDIAIIYKKPIPIQIVKVDYPKRSKAVIKEAYFRQPSTTDYNGVYAGYYIDFEAKETKNKTSFPLKNFHEHQIEHFKKCLKQDGVCFVIISFTSLNRIFVYPATELIKYWDTKLENRKSIPLNEIEKVAVELPNNSTLPVPYIDAVKKLFNL